MDALRDRRGLAVSTRNAHALDAFERALDALLGMHGPIGPHVDEALRRDPHWHFPSVVRVAARLLSGATAAARNEIAAAVAVAGDANIRERRHAAALRAWLAGDRHGALAAYDALLVDHPRDILALHVAHALDFRMGHRELLRDRPARVLSHWDARVPHFGYVLGMHAFGLEETGDYVRAEAEARRSLELLPDNAAAMHVIAHVHEMQGRAQEGIAFLESSRPTWSANAGFAVHNAWHLALFHIDRDDIGQALEIYDRTLRPGEASSAAVLVDASALLWRLELRGAPVGTRWTALAKAWQQQPLRGSRAFNLVHAMIAFVGAHRSRRADRVLELLRGDTATACANEPDDLALALPFCESVRAFGRHDYAGALEKIAAVRARAEQCGGSIAQCDLIHLTYIEAALRSRRARLAQALAAERTARRPQSLLNRWLFHRAGSVQAIA